MADTGWVVAGTGTNVPVSGGNIWNNPNNIITATDATFSHVITSSAPSANSAILRATNFGFTVPSDAIVTGVEVRVRGGGTNPNGGENITQDIETGLVLSGAAIGTAKGAVHSWPDFEYRSQEYGGTSDLWGSSIDWSDVSTTSFGVQTRVHVVGSKRHFNVATIWMRIHFEESGGGVFVRDGGIWKEGDAYVRDGGIWKPSQQYIRDSGVWKS